MFYFWFAIFWILGILISLFFGDPLYPFILVYSAFILKFCIFMCTLIFFANIKVTRMSNCLILLSFYPFYAQVMSVFLTVVPAWGYAMEISAFSVCAVLLASHPEYSTAKTIDKDNVLLAFYKGEKGSIIMRLSAMFGYPVKSMCIIAGDKALYLKANKPTFEFGSSAKIHRKNYNYVMVDTGIKYTGKFLYEMKKYSKTVATRGILRIRCIEAINDLLGMIDIKFKPSSHIPSLYLRQVIK